MTHSPQSALPRLMERSGHRCESCGVRVIMMRTVQARREIIGTQPQYVRWRTPWGTIAKMDTATVEHVIRKEDGGSNNIKNLKVYCWRCNNTNNEHAMQKQAAAQRRLRHTEQVGSHPLTSLLRTDDRNALLAMKKRLHQDPAQTFTMNDSEKLRRRRFIDKFHKKHDLTNVWNVPAEETSYMKWVALFTIIDDIVRCILYRYDEPIIDKKFRGPCARQLAHNCVLESIPVRDWIDSPDDIYIGRLT